MIKSITMKEPFTKEAVLKAFHEKTKHVGHLLTGIVIGRDRADEFMEGLKQDPQLSHEYYAGLLDEEKTKEELWRPFYELYKEHLSTEGKTILELGFLYGIPITFSDSVDPDSYVIMWEETDA